MNASDFSTKLGGEITQWCAERPVRLCVLFGSRARGTAGSESDTDLAIRPSLPISAQQLLEWHRDLTRRARSDVQVILITPELDPVLAMQIAREGVALFEDQPGEWLATRVKLWQAYQDSLPFLRASRKRLQAFAEEVRDGS